MKSTHLTYRLSGNELKINHFETPIVYDFKRFKKTGQRRIRTDKQKSEQQRLNLWRTRQNLRNIIQANAGRYYNRNGQPYRPQFLTLTFQDNVQEFYQANYCFALFITRLTYHLAQKENYPDKLKYLCVPEFQKRGAIHFHLVLFNLPYLDNIYAVLSQIWGQGYIFNKSVKDNEHLANYLSKYLSKEIRTESTDSRYFNKKRYFSSRGLFRPQRERDEARVSVVQDFLRDATIKNKATYKSQRTQTDITQTTYQLTDSELSTILALQAI